MLDQLELEVPVFVEKKHLPCKGSLNSTEEFMVVGSAHESASSLALQARFCSNVQWSHYIHLIHHIRYRHRHHCRSTIFFLLSLGENLCQLAGKIMKSQLVAPTDDLPSCVVVIAARPTWIGKNIGNESLILCFF